MTKPVLLPAFCDLRTQFVYDEDSGVIQYRKLSTKARRSRNEAGYVTEFENAPYRMVLVEYPSGQTRQIFAHRVIWKLMTAEEPPEEVDHINGDTLNNRWANLRDGSGVVNRRNRALHKNNTSGYCGVSWNSSKHLWYARAGVDGKEISLGLFKSKAEANKAAREFRLKNGFTDRHGS